MSSPHENKTDQSISELAGQDETARRDTREVFTIGHSTLPLDAFVELLRRYEINLLVDIRRHPGSRHEPQFGKEALSQTLDAAGIGYVHLPALGGRRRPRPGSSNVAWRNASFRGYADYMETAEFRAGLDQLTELARAERVAIMCAEAVWWRCHRALVADALTAQGWRVRHIMSDGTLKPHRLSAPARLVDGVLSYGDAATATEPATG